jgi:glycosyltransferase involved in cell wall biosynthesis
MDNVQAVIFNSPLGQDTTPWPYDSSQATTYYVPPPVDLEAFRQAGSYYEQRGERTKNIFVGRVDFTKGAHRAIDWALRNREALDLYGTQYHSFGELPEWIKFHGPQSYTKMPQIYGRAKRFVFLPVGPESYSRTTVEAWAAGCEMVVDWPKIGAGWWIENCPDKMEQERAVENFWTVVQDWLRL